MEPVRDPYVQYNELLIKAFEKIKKTVPKKFKELKELCNEGIGKLSLSPDPCRKSEVGEGRALWR